MNPRVSIIICTRNRAADLDKTLGSIRRLVLPRGLTTELVVVDNGSHDATALVIRRFSLPGIPIRYVHESRPGLSHARNAGIAAARGEILLFTDDDVRVPPDWVEGMCRPILENKASVVAGGVTIAPRLERDWLETYHRASLASTEGLDRAEPQYLVGANMAFKRDVLLTVPGFDPELGAGALGFAEELLFSKQLRAAGFRLWPALDVSVEHHFDPNRLRRAVFLQIARAMGRSEAYIAYHWEHRLVRRARLALLRSWIRLGYWYVRGMHDFRNSNPAPVWELQLRSSVSFWRQYLSERPRSRNYTRFGLVKLGVDSPRTEIAVPKTVVRGEARVPLVEEVP